MKWFRHMTDASDDEFISKLEAEFGLEGYARWWKILEVIGRQMDKSDRCSAEYPITKWMQLLSIKRWKILKSFVEFCAIGQKFNINYDEKILKIECPKLLEMRDEYSRKSGQSTSPTPDNVAPEAEAESEVDKVREAKQRCTSTAAKAIDNATLGGKDFESVKTADASLEASRSGDRAQSAVFEPKLGAVQVIQAFDEAIVGVWGEELRRPFPGANDLHYAAKFLELGADIAWLKAVFTETFQTFKSKNRQPPRGGLAYFRDSIPEKLTDRESVGSLTKGNPSRWKPAEPVESAAEYTARRKRELGLEEKKP